MHNQLLRATGRTTRMLQDAIEHAKDGLAVYVIAATRTHAQLLEKMLESIGGEEVTGLGIKFETAQNLGNFDWRTMRLAGASPTCVVLADHYAIEFAFARMLDMLHRYDLPEAV